MLLIYSESIQGTALYDRLATLDKPINRQQLTGTAGSLPT